MQRERCRFTLTVVEDFIYAIGGNSEVAEQLELEEEEDLTCERLETLFKKLNRGIPGVTQINAKPINLCLNNGGRHGGR